MKKKITIIVSLIISLSSQGQNTENKIKTTSPCNDAMLMEITGKWHQANHLSPGFMGLTQAQVQEGIKRLDAIHKIILEIYPEPVGAIGAGVYKTFQAEFANQIRYEKNSSGSIDEVSVTGRPFPFFYYSCAIYPYFCSGTNEISNLYGVAGAEGGIEISVNGGLSNFLVNNSPTENESLIDGRPIKMKKTSAKMWKGYELCYPSGAGGPENNEQSGSWCLLIHRKGMLPYTPVTKKQYLELGLKHFAKFYDGLIKGFDINPNKEQRDEAKNQMTKQKDEVMKYYRDELDKVTKDGSSDLPAIVQGMFSPLVNFPIFTTEEAGGSMLVTENPKYMRKDLPIYVPQFFLLSWSWNKAPALIKLGKAINENFPIDKLQAMIDK